MHRSSSSAIGLTAIAAAAMFLSACGSSKPVRLIVAVTSSPDDAKTQLHCRKEARRETKTPARFEVFVHRTPCKLELTRAGYNPVTVSVTEETLAKFTLPTEEEAREGESKTEGGLRALLTFLQHGVEVMVAAGTEAVMGDVRTDVRLHYILEPASVNGRMGDDDSLSNRTTSIAATAVSPATNPHHRPTTPIPNENPSSSATGNPSSQ